MQRLLTIAIVLVCGFAIAPHSAAAQGTVLPPGFAETTVWSGLGTPTVIRFAPDGSVFVATKAGRILRFDSVSDQTPAVFADLRPQVFDGWDRGLLGMALDPDYPARPYVYVAYARDRSPRRGLPWGDTCPTPPGPTTDGCEITGRLSRLAAGTETVLIEDFCQQYPSHTVGSIEFGPDEQLYMSAGDGASFNWADWGQRYNPCGDPPGAPGTG